MSTSPTAPISRPPGSLAQPSTRRYGFGNAWPTTSVAAVSAASTASAASGVLLSFVMRPPSSAARRTPAGCSRFRFGAKPALAVAFVDARLVVRRRAGCVIDALALAVDVAFDIAARAGRALGRRRPVARFVAAIVLRAREFAGPDAAARGARLVLLVDVVRAVAAIRRRESRAHHFRAEIGRPAAAHRDDAFVIVDVSFGAAHRSIADQAAQLARRFVAARPCAAVARARLAAFERVDAIEPEARRANLKGVAVRDFGSPADAFLRDARDLGAQRERGESRQEEARMQPHGRRDDTPQAHGS